MWLSSRADVIFSAAFHRDQTFLRDRSSLTRPHHRLENLHVSGTPAKIPRQTVANLSFSWMGVLLEQIHGRNDHSRCADAALRAAMFDEGLLHRMQLSLARRNAF